MEFKKKWNSLPDPIKILIRSLGISFAGYWLLPDGPWIWLILGNEVLKWYKFWQENKALDREMEEALQKAQEHFKNRDNELQARFREIEKDLKKKIFLKNIRNN